MRWLASLAGIAGIVTACRLLHVNPATAALSFLLYILLLASSWERRYPLAVSLVATACYNFFFLPPIGAFTIADPQNWLTLFAFLTTTLIGSRFSQKARDEAREALRRQREIELLLTLSRELLQSQEVSPRTLPLLVRNAAHASRAGLYLLQDDRFSASPSAAQPGDSASLRVLALSLTAPEHRDDDLLIPLHAGVRPRGLLLLRGSPLSMPGAQAAGDLVSIALDRAQALEDAARSEALKESERLRTLILDSITHELRTPLTSIKGAATALLSASALGADDRRELLLILDEEADRMDHLVTQAVETARIETREVRMHIAPVAVRDLVAAARADSAWVSAAHPITLHLPPLPRVLADPVMAAKVLCNLLENAAKYSDPASPIHISARQEAKSISISVTDSGIGIPPSEQSLIFERLYRGRARGRSVPGSGMGLALSRAIVQAHNGTLSVSSTPGQGSVFTFTLPIAAAEL